jgi:hypothetical protein
MAERIRVNLSLDKALWRRFQLACAILEEYPSRGIDALMEHWLTYNEEPTHRLLRKD